MSTLYTHADVTPKALVWQTIATTNWREQQYPDTYCVYHGLSKEAFIAMLANTYLDHLLYDTPLQDDFIKLRHDNDLYTGGMPIYQYP